MKYEKCEVMVHVSEQNFSDAIFGNKKGGPKY